MSVRVLRPLIGGGFSYCKSPDHLVGKGRCNHSQGESCEVSLDNQGNTYVEIKENSIESIGEEKIKALNLYIKDLENAIPKEKKNKILEFFKKYK